MSSDLSEDCATQLGEREHMETVRTILLKPYLALSDVGNNVTTIGWVGGQPPASANLMLE